MPSRGLLSPGVRYIATLIALTAVYFLAGRLGLTYALTHGSVSLVWPPSGIALGALLLLGRRLWPAVALGALLVNVTTSGSVGASLGIAVGNTLEAVVGATLIGRFANGRNVFDRAQDLFKFAVLGAALSSAVSATCGVTSLAAVGSAGWRDFGLLWLQWWLGDVGGILVVAPLVVLWGLKPRRAWNRAHLLEACALFLALVAVSGIVFGDLLPFVSPYYSVNFLCLPILIWSAIRFESREAATAAAVLSAVAVRVTARGVGPFASQNPNESLVLLGLFMSMVTVAVLSLAAVVSDRRRAQESMRGAYDELGLCFRQQGEDLSRTVHDLRRAIQARSGAERYAQAIVETSGMSVLVLDPQLQVKTANPAFFGLFQVGSHETENASVYELGNGILDIPALRKVLQEVLLQKTKFDELEVEHAFRGIGPKTLWVYAQWIVQDAAGGGLILLSFQDMTERKQAEKALRGSEERFRAFAETALDGIVSADSRGQITFFNRAAEFIFGYSSAEVLGQPLQVLMPDRFHSLHRQGRTRYLETGQTEVLGKLVELVGRRKDGAEFPLELSVASWHSGPEVHFTAIIRDITQRKAVEQKLMQSEARLARAQALTHMGSWSWDVEHDRVSWSDELFRIHGVEPSSVSLSSEMFMSLIHPQDRLTVETRMRQSLMDGAAFALDHRIIRPDGVIRWLHTRAEVEQDAAGTLRMHGTAQDIMESKQAEQKIRRLNAELERRVQERTAELRKSNEELQRFAYVAAHDLQEPLRTVAGYTQLLAKRYKGQLGPEADEWIAFATDGVTWMHRLIDDLLAYSRTGSTEMHFEPTNCAVVLERVLANLEGAMKDTQTVVTHGPLPTLIADESQLARVLQNLIGNAIKFRGKGPPRIQVAAKRHDDEWTFSVRDHGMGMEPVHLDHIFEVFRRLHSREEFPGTGIGLAICKRIVERHGGRIWAESRPGRGSTFRFAIPSPAGKSPEPAAGRGA